MKNLYLLVLATIASFGFSSCCGLFHDVGSTSMKVREKKLVRYEYEEREVTTPGDSKSGKDGLTRTERVKIPVYKWVTKTVRCPAGCVRPWTPDYGCCGSTGERTMRMATVQSASGSPHMGLIPTMKPLAP